MQNATAIFKKREVSGCHHEAVDVVITIPSATRDIGEQLSLQHAKEKETNRTVFMKILTGIFTAPSFCILLWSSKLSMCDVCYLPHVL